MAAITGPVNGTSFGIYIGGTLIAKATSSSLSRSHGTRDATSKDSAGDSESLEGLREWSIEGEGLFAFDSAYGVVDLNAVLQTRTAVVVRFSTETTTDQYWNGSAILTELSVDSSTEETVTYSYSFQGTGPLNFTALT